MARRYHSPSSTELGRRCQRAFAYCYLDGLRDPDVPWREEMATRLPPGVTPKQRSGALGVAGHGVIERWYTGTGSAADWHTYPGQVVEAGRHLLPQPHAVEARVEVPIGCEPLPPKPDGAEDNGPTVGMTAGGILWAGYRDLVAVGAPELARLRIDAPDGIALFDHKTTASIRRYAKSTSELADDLQCNLYALATMNEAGRDIMPARWVYYETKEVRRALPIDVTIERARAEEIVGRAAELARTLDAIERSVDAPQNVNACGDYGGCSYHVSAGGPCNARRSAGQLIKLGKGRMMALTEEQRAKFNAFRKTPTAAKQADDSAVEAGEAEETETAEAAAPAPAAPAPRQLTLPHVNGVSETPPAAPRPRGRPRKVVPPPAPPAGSIAEILGNAHAEIAAAELAIQQATMRRDEAIAAAIAALQGAAQGAVA